MFRFSFFFILFYLTNRSLDRFHSPRAPVPRARTPSLIQRGGRCFVCVAAWNRPNDTTQLQLPTKNQIKNIKQPSRWDTHSISSFSVRFSYLEEFWLSICLLSLSTTVHPAPVPHKNVCVCMYILWKYPFRDVRLYLDVVGFWIEGIFLLFFECVCG